MLGTVKFFERFKGWGYITPDDETVGDVYVHWTMLPDDCEHVVERYDDGEGKYIRTPRRWLEDGQRVKFDVTDTGRGPRAANLKLVKQEWQYEEYYG
jgi:cold shock CspA family protein